MFVDDNGNHMAFSGQYETETEDEGKQTARGGTASYILGGNVELGVSFAKANFDHDEGSSYDFDLNFIGGGGYYYIKNVAPVNFVLGAGFDTVSADGNFLEGSNNGVGDMTMEGSLISYGGGAYKQVASGAGYQITPFVLFSMNSMELTMDIDGFGELEETDEYNVISFGLGIELGQFTITPTMSSSDGNNDFNLTVGFIL